MYRNCYFRIESNYMKLSNEETYELYDEIVDLFKEAGWKYQREYENGRGPEIQKGKSELYIHPQSLSGDIDTDLISEIEEILSKGIRFKHYRTDQYEEVFDWSNERYLQYLEQNKEQITAELLDGFKTKRSNLYINMDFWSNPANKISEQYVRRILLDVSGITRSMTCKYVDNQFKQLVLEGKILVGESKNGICFRTAKEVEMALMQSYLKYCCEESEPISEKSAQSFAQKMLANDPFLHADKLSQILNYAEWVEKNAHEISDSCNVQVVYDNDMQCYRAENDEEIWEKEQHEEMQMS